MFVASGLPYTLFDSTRGVDGSTILYSARTGRVSRWICHVGQITNEQARGAREGAGERTVTSF